MKKLNYILIATALTALFFTQSAKANTTLFWDANGTQGGTGPWDTTTSNWDSAATGGTVGTYNNTDPSTITANLGFTSPGTAGILTIATGTTINVNNLTFAKTGFTVAGTDATSILNLDGITPTIDFSAAGVTGSTITASVQGSNLTIKGASGSQLNLNGNNSGITGTTILNLNSGAVGVNPGNAATGTVSPVVSGGNNNAFGTSAIQFNSNGSINFRDNGDNTGSVQSFNYGNNVVLNAGDATFNVGKVGASGGSTNKTFAFGTVTFNTANTLTFAGSIATGTTFDRISFSGVSLGANGTMRFTATGGFASIGAISETAAGKSFTLANGTIDGVGSTAGTLTVTGASTYTGATNIQVGTLVDGVLNALPTGTTLTLGSAAVAATLDMNGNAQTLGGLATAGTATTNTITNNSTTANSTLTYAGTGSSTFGGIITQGTAVGHKATALAVSSGALSLTGANTYSGGTTVTGGTLSANNTAGSAMGTGAVDIQSTGILGGGNNTGAVTSPGAATLGIFASGKGSISGPVTIESGAHLAPGNGGVGTLSTVNLTLNSGAIADYEFNGTANDFTAATTLTLNGGGFNLFQEGTTTAFDTVGTYDLLGYNTSTGTLAGSLANLSVLNQQAGFSYTFINDSADGLIQLQIGTAEVPEPGTWAMMLSGLAVLVFIQSRRKLS